MTPRSQASAPTRRVSAATRPAVRREDRGSSVGSPRPRRTPLPGGGWVNGHNDYKYINPAQPLAMYSPYYDTLANQLRCGAATGSATATC